MIATPLLKQVQHQLQELQFLLSNLNDEAFVAPLKILHGTAIGAHIRHIIELFEELDKGYYKGIVNYDERKRNKQIENDKHFAIALLQLILTQVDKVEKPLILACNHGGEQDEALQIPSTYLRELVYNLEHMVHHMAVIKIAVENSTTLTVAETFGVAASTTRHQQLCAR